jgi:hypothetical protein
MGKKLKRDLNEPDKDTVPHVRFDFYLVPHGYEMDTFLAGKDFGGRCRDFSGSHHTPDLAASLIRAIQDAVDNWGQLR